MKHLPIAIALSGLILFGAGCSKPATTPAATEPSAPTAPVPPPVTGDQAGCDAKAKIIFDRQNYAPENKASFAGHYNARMKACYMEVTSEAYAADYRANQVMKSLFDADTGELIGTLSYMGSPDSRVQPVPMVCLIQGKTCATEAEYDAYTNSFLEK